MLMLKLKKKSIRSKTVSKNIKRKLFSKDLNREQKE